MILGRRYAEELCGTRPGGARQSDTNPCHLVQEQPGVGSLPSAKRLWGRAEAAQAGSWKGEPSAEDTLARPGARTLAGFPQQRPHRALLPEGCFPPSLGFSFDPFPCRGDIDCTSYLLIKGVTYIIIL